MDDKPVALATLSSLPATGEAPLPVSPQPSDPIRTPSTAARSDDDNDHKLDKTIGRADSGDGKSAVVGAGEAVAGGHWRLKNLDDGFDSKAADAPTEPLRRRWWDYLLRRYRPPPPAAPPSLDDAEITPLASASFLSLLTFSWITPLMDLGYRRTLQATDLWKMDPSRESGPLADSLLAAFARRQVQAEAHNVRLDAGQVHPPLWTRVKWLVADRAGRERREKTWRAGKGRKKASLAWSLNEGVALFFWTGGLFKVVGDTAQLCGPLVTRQIILFAQAKARHNDSPTDVAEPHIGRGVGMAIGLLLLTIVASVCQHQFFWRSMSVGALTRARLTAAIYSISIHLTQKERTHLSNGKLLAHLSTDVSRVDFASQWFHAVWTAPIQLVITTILLLLQIGPSALVGIALFIFLTPVQTRIMGMQFQVRKRSMRFTDSRSRLLQELLGSFAIVKYFTLERPFLERIGGIRWSELQGIRSILLIKAANQSIAMSLPTLAAVVSFLCYAGIGNDLNPAAVFTALSLFQLLRQPLMFLPRALSAIADAQNALERLTVVFEAETLAVTTNVDPTLDVGIRVSNASFQWMAPPPEENVLTKSSRKTRKVDKNQAASPIPIDEKTLVEVAEPFRIQGLNLEVKRGAITVLAGRVGSGKSSILQGLIGDMRKTSPEGKVEFGGRVAYCSQTAFIQNASLRENVLFGRPFEKMRYWQCMADACLIADCLTLPDADLTEIGEKGVNLSGGQKQRVNIARALYFDAEIVIFDDPLSAVDAAVSQALFQDAICARLRSSNVAVLLVTHALHILPAVDYIYTVEDGRIVEEGSFSKLMAAKGPFSELVHEFGGDHADESEEAKMLAAEALARDNKLRRAEAIGKSAAASGTGRLEGRLIVAEKRHVGKIKGFVYWTYIKAGRGFITLPLLLGAAFLMQGCLVLSSVWLTWWQGDHFNIDQGEYMGIYAALGVSQALFTFAMGATMAIISFNASGRLHHAALHRLFFAPLSLFQSQPLGRLMSVLGKDCDTIDNVLADSLRMAIMTMANVLGSVVLICIFLPYFLIAVVVLLFGYVSLQNYYRRSAREVKRIDALLRSVLYSHFSESLTGLSTIRAYDVVQSFVAENRHYMDLESRALQLSVVSQRWLAIRLDVLGAILSFVVGLMCVVGVRGISPAQVGLVLSFCISLTQQLGMVTRQTAEVETNMNAVERVVHYKDLPQEAAYEVSKTEPPLTWPAQGQINFYQVVIAYRPDLPPVLKGFSLDVRSGEKVGVVGRTGAGKSTIMSALFRLVELTSGSISIDGIDISSLGLSDVRSAVTIIPQDPQLFSGTVRSNLDPFSRLSDADLWSALRRAHLVTSVQDEGKTNKFGLDSVVDEDGANFSVGQRSLLSLARALCKDAKIIVLDEATASVDAASDAQIQQTIATEFADKTVLTIAHRLRTILHCDRILCLDEGVIAEIGKPLELFQRDGLFRAMALRSNLSEADFAV